MVNNLSVFSQGGVNVPNDNDEHSGIERNNARQAMETARYPVPSRLVAKHDSPTTGQLSEVTHWKDHGRGIY